MRGIDAYNENIAIKNYYKDVKKTNVLSGEEQIDLAVRAKAGDRVAFDQLVECNLRFVISVAKEYTASGIPLEDLISEGNIGLMEAVNRFDETRGFRFISYAVWWIRQSIIKSINDNKSNVRLPINKINSINKITKAREKLSQRLERSPNESEIMDALDVSLSEVKSYMFEGNFEMHIDDQMPHTDGMEYKDMLTSDDHHVIENNLNYSSLKKELERAMSDLSDRERSIISMYYGLNDGAPMKLKEIGEVFNLTNERVRQIMLEAEKKIRVFSKSQKLREFLKMTF